MQMFGEEKSIIHRLKTDYWIDLKEIKDLNLLLSYNLRNLRNLWIKTPLLSCDDSRLDADDDVAGGRDLDRVGCQTAVALQARTSSQIELPRMQRAYDGRSAEDAVRKWTIEMRTSRLGCIYFTIAGTKDCDRQAILQLELTTFANGNLG